MQLPVFLAVLAAYSVLLHRSVYGRSFYAIGFSEGAARYSGIPVGRRIGLVYLLAGLLAFSGRAWAAIPKTEQPASNKHPAHVSRHSEWSSRGRPTGRRGGCRVMV